VPLGLETGAFSRFGGPLQQRALGVATDEARVEPSHEVERFLRERPPREVAAEDDQVRLFGLDLGEHGLERGCVAVDVGERGDARKAPRQPALRIARISSHLPILDRPAMFFFFATS
jgi:hypothetical protein